MRVYLAVIFAFMLYMDIFFQIKDKKAIHVLAAPIGCCLFDDEEHHNLAKNCSYCEEFDCFRNYEEEI